MKPRTLSLTEQERKELEEIRDKDPKPYRRERAAAMLKVAEGMPAVTVALKGLLKPRHPETILIWLNHYQQNRTIPYQPARRKRLSPPRPAKGASTSSDQTES